MKLTYTASRPTPQGVGHPGWARLLFLFLTLLPAFAALAQNPAVPSTTSFTGIANGTLYASSPTSPATATNVSSTGWTFTGIGTGAVLIEAVSGTVGTGQAGALGLGDPWIRVQRGAVGAELTEARVRTSGGLAFRLNSVALVLSSFEQGTFAEGPGTLTLTGYRGGVAVPGATQSQSTTTFTWRPFTTSGNAAFSNIDEFRVTLTGTDAGKIRAYIGVDEINIGAAAVLNQAPTIANQTRSVAENVANGTNVGAVVAASDPDAGQTLTYAITAGNADGKLAINAGTGQLTVAGALDFETTPSYALTVRVTDNAATPAFSSATVTVNLTNVNEAPTNLALSSATLAENNAANATVGTLSSTDPDAGNSFTYSLVSGAGSTDNGAVFISGNALGLTAPANFEAQPAYSVRVRTTDQGGLIFERAFTITITNVNEAPSVSAQTRSVAENSANGTAVGAPVTATDPDAGTTLTYSITGGNTGGRFAINASTGQLTVAGALDFETTPNYALTVQVSDGTLTGSATVRVDVTDVPAPAISGLNPTSGPVGTPVTLTGTDFGGLTGVSFGGTAATVFAFVNATTATATVPAGAAAGPVTLTTGEGTSPGVAFTVTLPATAAPVLTAPANNSLINDNTPAYTGTAPAGSTVTVFVDGASSGTATATGGSFSLTQPTALADGPHTVRATAQSAGATVSFSSATNAFTVDTQAPTVTLASSAGAAGSSTSTSPIPFTATFSESVTDFVVTDITVSGGAVTGGSLSGTGSGYSFTVTPSGAGTVAVTLIANGAQDVAGNGNVGSATYTLIYSLPPLTLSPATLPGGTVATAYSQTLTATGGTAPYTYTLTGGSLPGGLTLSAGGVLAGTPTAGGSFSFTIRATDATAPTALTGSRAYTLAIAVPTIALSPATLPAGTVAATYSQSVTATGGTSPYSYTVTAGALPGGLTLTTGGVLAGTPTAGGTFNFTVTATDASTGSGPYTGSRAYAATIAAAAPTALTVSTGSVAAPTSIPAGSYTTITITGTGNAILSGAVSVGTGLVVQAGGSLNTNCQPLTGAGNFTLAAGTTLFICDPNGISQSGATGAVQVTGTRAFDPDASYGYTGTQSQTTGNGLPTQVRNLATSNNNALTLTRGVAVRQAVGLGGAGNLVLNGQALTLLSDAAGTALVVNAGMGVVQGTTATVQRFIDPSLNPGSGYRHYAAPVSGSTVADLGTTASGGGFTPVVNAAYNGLTPDAATPFPNVFGYNQARLADAGLSAQPLRFGKGWESPAALSSPLEVGRGYTVQIGAAEKVDFTGTLTTGTLLLTLARNTTGTAAENAASGLHLLGNPYPAPLDWSAVTRTGVDAALFVFESTGPFTGAYRSFANGIGAGGSSVVASGQGFFARVTPGQASGTVTFTNAARQTSFGPTPVFRRGGPDTRPQLHLSLGAAGAPAAARDGLYVYEQAGATAGVDAEFDAAKLPNPSGLNLSATAATEALSIQGLPVLSQPTRIALTVQVPAAGAFTLQADQVLNLPAGARLWLVDSETGQQIDLRQPNPAALQVSAANAGTWTSRYYLNWVPAAGPLTAAPALTAGSVRVYPNPATQGQPLTVLIPAVAGASRVEASLVNALGLVVRRLPATALPASGARLQVPTQGLSSGVYVLRLSAGAASVGVRVFVH